MDFRPLFEPRTLAVVGVSLQNDRHPANVIYNKNSLRYPVNVFPVNLKGGVYQSETVFPRVSDIPEQVDLAVIAARAEQVHLQNAPLETICISERLRLLGRPYSMAVFSALSPFSISIFSSPYRLLALATASS